MLAPQLREDLVEWLGTTGVHVVETLPDGLLLLGKSGEREQALILVGILEDGGGAAIEGEEDGTVRGLELFDQFGGAIPESFEGLGVRSIDHGCLRCG
jgi:hypothetical protein